MLEEQPSLSEMFYQATLWLFRKVVIFLAKAYLLLFFWNYSIAAHFGLPELYLLHAVALLVLGAIVARNSPL